MISEVVGFTLTAYQSFLSEYSFIFLSLNYQGDNHVYEDVTELQKMLQKEITLRKEAEEEIHNLRNSQLLWTEGRQLIPPLTGLIDGDGSISAPCFCTDTRIFAGGDLHTADALTAAVVGSPPSDAKPT
ncbi:hypothetical protein L6452_20288 [Arctium lappa]|uniref:Uncharacterized protein n=1 Tax=Arctium lappa TaxID=4217 RepID=A0ACB9BAY9_ARCLA|nr:hypothetical protein L6452_20288 [Arctium lappa]